MGAKSSAVGDTKKILVQSVNRVLVRIDTTMVIRDRQYDVYYHEFWNDLEMYEKDVRVHYPDRYSEPVYYCVKKTNLTDEEAVRLFNAG